MIMGSLIPVLERAPEFMATAGALLAATGLLDAILWSSILLFSGKEDLANTGLDQFTFMRTPEGRTLGNIVFVQGGGKDTGGGIGGDLGRHGNRRQSWHSRKDKGWWRLGDRGGNESHPSSSQEHLPGGGGLGDGIQMEVVTMVVSERQDGTRIEPSDLSREDSRDATKSLGSSL